MTSKTRKLLAAAGGLVVLLLLLLALVPALFGGRIAERVKAQVNRTLLARVDWRDAHLGVFHDFPNVTLGLDGLTVAGVGRFEHDTLAVVNQLRVVLDLGSVVRSALGGSGPMVVRAVELDHPVARLIELEDGTANWQITRPSADTTGGRAVRVSLKRFTIDRGAILFDNRAAKVQALLKGIDQTLSGDFSKDLVDLETRLHADSATVRFANLTYLNGVRADLTANVRADMVKKLYTLREGTGLRLNELALAAQGSVAQQGPKGERLALDLAFGAPKTDFKGILSLVPAVYAKDFKSVRTSGALAVSGRVRGEYGKDAFPAFAVSAKVTDGTFRYPDLPLPARDVALDLALTNPGGSPDSTVVDLSRFHVVLGRNPIDARMVLRTPVSDPDVDARLKGTLDLADLRRTVKLDQVQELRGVVSADAAVKTRMSWLDKGQYDRVAASGTIAARDLAVKGAALKQPVTVTEATLALAPRRAELRSLSGTAGSSDFAASGAVENLLGYVFRDEDLRGSATVNSNRFVLDEWKSDTGSLKVIPVPKGIDFALAATVKQLLYGKMRMSDAHGRLRIKDQRLTLEDFAVNTLGGSIGVTGYYETTHPAKPTFDVGLKLQQLDIPQAVATLATVQAFAPVAKYAQGTFSTDMRLTGPLQENMLPVFAALTGQGTLQTSQLVLKDFPALEKLAAKTKLTFLTEDAIRALRSQFTIENGRFRVQPFTVGLGQASMQVAGSNGLDQSLDYTLHLAVPRALIGPQANQALAGILSKATAAGFNLQAAPELGLDVRLTGKVTDPAVGVDLGSVAGSATQAVQQAAEQRAQAVVDTAKQRLSAEAQRLLAEADSSAAKIRAEAQALADRVKAEGNQRADSLAARGGTNPLAQTAAKAAADRLRQESDARAAQIVREANARADSVVAAARRRAGAP
ncbi:MAG TPA: AsmA-like C-terminal region-containing protein [Gemmatimonadales bacterium]|nr:AsmA-like C-terminal region-containing protein [Gemmatimonadales bacterium]